MSGCVPKPLNHVNEAAQSLEPTTWRSSLYPEDWTSAFTDSAGRFLHDFSYAGYRSGAVALPDSHELPLFNVQSAPYLADASGQSNAAPAIQRAIDDARQAGGGIIFLPAGNYRLDFDPEQKAALSIKSSHIVLRGEGESTRLFTLEENMRERSLVQITAPQNRWTEVDASASIALVNDAVGRTMTVELASLRDLKEGDAIILRSDVTEEFASELGMGGLWEGKVDGPHIYRRITAIDQSSQSITLDVPVRFPLRVRDHARVYKVTPPIEEIGVEQLSFGMKQLPIGGLEEDDFNKPGTAGYQSHRAFALRLAHVQNSWIRAVTSFQLAQNSRPVHLLSGGILLERSRFITVADSQLSLPLYKGAGGNGYLYEVANSQEILIRDSSGRGGRHNFDLKYMGTSGVVFLRCKAIDGVLASDFHMHLSAAVLFDSTLVDGDMLEARYRDSGTVKHGQSATESVFWNTHGLRYSPKRKSIVLSQQWGLGYVIGTKGPAFEVATPVGLGTDPKDFVEGLGIGQNLEPQSLYEDQLQRRMHGAGKSSQVR
jgi:hypothetical protein